MAPPRSGRDSAPTAPPARRRIESIGGGTVVRYTVDGDRSGTLEIIRLGSHHTGGRGMARRFPGPGAARVRVARTYSPKSARTAPVSLAATSPNCSGPGLPTALPKALASSPARRGRSNAQGEHRGTGESSNRAHATHGSTGSANASRGIPANSKWCGRHSGTRFSMASFVRSPST